jgi:hypothetical protein
MSSFEILENSFGGSFPSTIKLEEPPKLTVKIVEDSFIQKLIIILSGRKQLKDIYSLSREQVKNELLEQSPDAKVLKVLIPIIFPFIALKKIIKTFLGRSPYEPYGYVSPFKKNTIYIISNHVHDINKTISHENIHVLQGHHGDLDMDKRRMDIERVDNYCKHYTSHPDNEQYFIRYLFSKVEIEARVHELVSAFYISTRQLPLSRNEFLVCLLYSNDILHSLDTKLELFSLQSQLQFCRSNPKNILDLLSEIKKHAIVMSIPSPITISTHVTTDFSCILNTINGPEALFNFISFELPTYYCNVLKLYGSKSASAKLQNEINKERELYK